MAAPLDRELSRERILLIMMSWCHVAGGCDTTPRQAGRQAGKSPTGSILNTCPRELPPFDNIIRYLRFCLLTFPVLAQRPPNRTIVPAPEGAYSSFPLLLGNHSAYQDPGLTLLDQNGGSPRLL